MHDMTEYRRLGLIMVVGFAATIGVLWWRDQRGVPPAATSLQPPADERPHPLVATSSHAVAVAVPATPPAAEPGAGPPIPGTPPPSEETAAPATAALHVFVNRLRDTDRRRIRVANTGVEPIDCLVRVWRNGSVIGERQVELRFNTEVTLGVEDDLEVRAGDKIVVQSSLGPQLADVEVS